MDMVGLEIDAILEEVPSGITLLKDRRYAWVNRAMSEISGYAQDELIGQPTSLMYSNIEEHERVGREAYAVLLRGDSYATEIAIRRKDNELRWVTVSGRLLDPADASKGSVWFMQDVTPLKRYQNEILQLNESLEQRVAARTGELRDLESQLREAHALNEEILVTSPVGIAAYRQDGQCVMVNPAFAEMVGATEDRLLAQNFRQIESWRVSGLRESAERVLSSGQTLTLKTFVNTTFGRALWLDCQLSRFHTQREPHLLLVFHNITNEKLASDALIERERSFRTLADNIPDNIIRCDREGRALFVNQTLATTLGCSAADLLGKTAHENFPDGRFAAIDQAIRRVAATGEPESINQVVSGQNGEVQHHLIRLVPEVDADGKPATVLAVGRDLSSQRMVEEQLKLAASVFHNSAEGVLITDQDGVIQSVNPAFSEITGYQLEEVVGRKPSLLRSNHHGADFYKSLWDSLTREKRWEGEIWNRRKDGEAYLQWMTINAVPGHDGETVRYVSVFHDVTESRRKEEHIRHLAFHDALTGLPNRALFQERLDHAVSRSQREGTRLSVTFIDLDGFKGINDTRGHDVGDLLLKEMATRIGRHMRRGTDTVARLGGDEFVVLMEDLKEAEHCACMAAEIIADISKPVVLQGQTMRVGASMGMAFFPEDGATAQDLMRRADTAMYAAKASGKGTYRFFSANMLDEVTERLTLEQELRLAIDQGELVLHYQPKICITDGKLRGVEALVRWLHPRRGLLPPSDFLAMAEESGLILALGDWVLDEACRQAAAWQAQGESICIAVNVSARQLVKGDLVGRVKELTALHGIPATALQIELTETALMVDPVKAIETLGSLREMGMGIAVDDFGTGYSSLSRLRSLPIDLLKIDRSFVMNAEHDARDAQVVRTIIALAQNLGLEVVAEGVESEAHASMLKDSGCTVCQGYHYGHPQSASQLEAFLRRQA